MVVTLDGNSLTVDSAISIASKDEQVKVSPASLKRMSKFRSVLEEKLERKESIYGVNTGFGSLSNEQVKVDDLNRLQLNLIRSHAAGVGNPLPPEVVRAAMAVRLNSLLSGNSAARPAVALLIQDLLNTGVTPLVPEFGSLGASGDLVPCAHVALTLVGEGRAYHRGKLRDSSKALRSAGLKPVSLRAKEGLSLINGTAFTTALGCIGVDRSRVLLGAANASVAVACEALAACSQSFDEALVGLKLDPGQDYVASQIRSFLAGSTRVRSEPVPQDPYSLRCAPQVHGSLKDAIDFAEKIVVNEANSVSDNPVLLEDGTFAHGGNFHAQPVAMAMDLLAMALSYLGVMSLSRTGLLLAGTHSSRKFMTRKPGLESGLMILQYTSTALAADNAKQVYPQSTYPANVSGGIEDHASHGVNAGMKALAVAGNVSKMLAIELICTSNALGDGPRGVSDHCLQVLAAVREASPLLRGDRSLGGDIESLSETLISGRLP